MQQVKIEDKYDKEFISLVLEIERNSTKMSKHDKLKIDSWVKSLCMPTNNREWKKNRNMHTILLLDMIINGKLEEPYNKFANQFEELKTLSKPTVLSRISSKFFKVVSFTNSEPYLNEFIDTHLIPEKTSTPKASKVILKPKQMRPASKNTHNKTADALMKISPSDYLLSKTYLNINSTKNKLITEYKYEKDIEKLKRLLKALEEERTLKDEIIISQNQEKNKILYRINELEGALDQLILKNDKSQESVKKISKILYNISI